MTIVATGDIISIYDGEGNRLGEKKISADDNDDQPIKLMRTQSQSELAFLLVKKKSL